MRLTRFTDYSLRVLIFLGQNNDRRVTIHQISEAYDISKNHLMKVVSNLTRQKFLVAQRGPGGGIQLHRPPAEINLGEVISSTEKHLQLPDAECTTTIGGETAESRLSNILQQALQSYLDELGHFTLADVIEKNIETSHLLEINEQAA
jgi:Rrf2 family nitric oxide-sensitive transcriptional repressor